MRCSWSHACRAVDCDVRAECWVDSPFHMSVHCKARHALRGPISQLHALEYVCLSLDRRVCVWLSQFVYSLRYQFPSMFVASQNIWLQCFHLCNVTCHTACSLCMYASPVVLLVTNGFSILWPAARGSLEYGRSRFGKPSLLRSVTNNEPSNLLPGRPYAI